MAILMPSFLLIVWRPPPREARTGATHKFVGTLDLIINGSDVVIESVEVDPPGIISEHGLMSCCIPIRSYSIHQRSNEFVRSLGEWTDSLRGCQEQSYRNQTICLWSTIPHSTISWIDLHHFIPFNPAICPLSTRLDADCRYIRRNCKWLNKYYRTKDVDDKLAWNELVP